MKLGGSADASVLVLQSSQLRGQLLGFGRGTPPPWVHDAAGAELWAFFVAIRESTCIPRTVSDCRGIRDSLQLPRHQLLGLHARLGRTWAMILHAIDSNMEEALDRMVWMPSHTSASRMATSPPTDSSGNPITWLDWRANRFVDVLAKSAAAGIRLPPSVFNWLRSAEALQKHQAAVLGMVTYAATHHEQHLVDENGHSRIHIMRDSWGQRPHKPRTWRRCAPQQGIQSLVLPSSSASSSSSLQRPSSLAPREKHKRLSALQAQKECVVEARQVACHLAATHLQPAGGPSAAERLAALHERVRTREADDKAWLEEQRRASLL